MSLNNVQLHPKLLAALYADVLVATDTPAPTKKKLNALGGNQKKILVVADKENEIYLPENELVFLTTVLAACKLSLADVAIINYKNIEEKEYKKLIEYFGATTVLLFHLTPLEFGLPINFPHFQIQAFNGVTYLSAPELHLIENEISLKKQLWPALKNIFRLP